jgi:hypothetical protein
MTQPDFPTQVAVGHQLDGIAKFAVVDLRDGTHFSGEQLAIVEQKVIEINGAVGWDVKVTPSNI